MTDERQEDTDAENLQRSASAEHHGAKKRTTKPGSVARDQANRKNSQGNEMQET